MALRLGSQEAARIECPGCHMGYLVSWIGERCTQLVEDRTQEPVVKQVRRLSGLGFEVRRVYPSKVCEGLIGRKGSGEPVVGEDQLAVARKRQSELVARENVRGKRQERYNNVMSDRAKGGRKRKRKKGRR